MKKPEKEEALRWLIHAQDEFNDADKLRKRKLFNLIFLMKFLNFLSSFFSQFVYN